MQFILPTAREKKILSSWNGSRLSLLEWSQSPDEREFLMALILRKKPKKCLEIGIAAGGSSAAILYALKQAGGGILHSIDIDPRWPCMAPREKQTHATGWVVDQFPDLKKNWRPHLGGIALRYMEEIGGGIDFCFIDAAHCNPGEMLDYLMVLPFLSDDCLVVFHDVNLHTVQPFDAPASRGNHTNSLMMSAVSGEKLLQDYAVTPSFGTTFPNMGAVRLSAESKEHAWEVLNLLAMPWSYLPKQADLDAIARWFRKYYGAYYARFFSDLAAYQKKLMTWEKKQAAPAYPAWAVKVLSSFILSKQKRQIFRARFLRK